jgi:hypothetical protein
MDPELKRLLDEREVADVVVSLFVATDRRDWVAVSGCFAEKVTLDMTSMAGGEPGETTGGAIAAMWEEGLRPMDRVHHQVGNLRVKVAGDEAKATCYGIALHHREAASPRATRVFVGSYDLRLRRTEERWRIESFRFDLAFIEGNPELEKA